MNLVYQVYMGFCLRTALFGETMAEHAECELFFKTFIRSQERVGFVI
jgi:hypothetical protein